MTQCALRECVLSSRGEEETAEEDALEAVVGVDDRRIQEAERCAEEGDEAERVEEEEVVERNEGAVALRKVRGGLDLSRNVLKLAAHLGHNLDHHSSVRVASGAAALVRLGRWTEQTRVVGRGGCERPQPEELQVDSLVSMHE